MSAADVWKAAPQAVRQSTLSQTTVSNKTAPRPKRSTNNPKPGFDIDEQDTSTEGGTNSVSSSRHTRNQRQPSMDITVETSHSPLTKATNGNTTRARNTSDLEASVARQQAEFQKLSEKLKFIDESVKRANEAYFKKGSLQVQLDQMFLLLQKICENVDVNQPTPKRATRKKKKQSTPSSSDVSMNLSNASSTSESRHIASPGKKETTLKTPAHQTPAGQHSSRQKR